MSPLFPPGEVIAGKLRIERALGQGGMGQLYVATHLGLDERVALKILRSHIADSPTAVRRFLREARAASRLRGASVARVLDLGEVAGAPYLVMELLDGRDAALVLEDEAPLTPTRVARWILEAAAGVAEAHARGIVHRDLKPSNLFVTRGATTDGPLKVLDFGVSLLRDENVDGHLTATAGVVGTPFYMSPEQISHPRDVDGRADVWSLGATAFELLTGKPPFRGDGLYQIFRAICESPTPNIAALRGGVPDGLADVVTRCLEKDPAARFQTMVELCEALVPFAGPHGPWLVERARECVTLASEQSPEVARGRESQTVDPDEERLVEAKGGQSSWDGSLVAPSRPPRGRSVAPWVWVVATAAAAAIGLSTFRRTPSSGEPARRIASVAPAPSISVSTLSPPATAIVPGDPPAASPSPPVSRAGVAARPPPARLPHKVGSTPSAPAPRPTTTIEDY